MYPLLLLALWPYCPGFRLPQLPDLLFRRVLTLSVAAGIAACSTHACLNSGLPATQVEGAAFWLMLLGALSLCLLPLSRAALTDSLNTKPQVVLPCVALLHYGFFATLVESSEPFTAAALSGLSTHWGRLLLVVFAVKWFSRRNQPAVAMAGGAQQSAFQGAAPPQGGFGGFGGGAAAPQPQAPVVTPIQIQDADFGQFERLLGESQSAYSDENMDRMRMVATSEMVSYFSQEIAANARNGVVNKVSNVKLLQGDLAEAWREGAEEYATVAMRFSLIDVMQDRATGRVVSGNPSAPDQATEVWTFLRPVGSGQQGWKLSAIQQAA
jgi:hypothetical protein